MTCMLSRQAFGSSDGQFSVLGRRARPLHDVTVKSRSYKRLPGHQHEMRKAPLMMRVRSEEFCAEVQLKDGPHLAKVHAKEELC